MRSRPLFKGLFRTMTAFAGCIVAVSLLGGCKDEQAKKRAETQTILEQASQDLMLATVDAVLTAYRLVAPGYPHVEAHPVALEAMTSVLDEEIRIVASPALHSRPTLSLRVGTDRAVLGLSSDTLPSAETEQLCAGADVLLHDCGGVEVDRDNFGVHHASAADAGAVARRAGVKRLYLTHLPPLEAALEGRMLAEAGARFDGPVALARDGDRYDVGAVG